MVACALAMAPRTATAPASTARGVPADAQLSTIPEDSDAGAEFYLGCALPQHVASMSCADGNMTRFAHRHALAFWAVAS